MNLIWDMIKAWQCTSIFTLNNFDLILHMKPFNSLQFYSSQKSISAVSSFFLCIFFVVVVVDACSIDFESMHWHLDRGLSIAANQLLHQ